MSGRAKPSQANIASFFLTCSSHYEPANVSLLLDIWMLSQCKLYLSKRSETRLVQTANNHQIDFNPSSPAASLSFPTILSGLPITSNTSCTYIYAFNELPLTATATAIPVAIEMPAWMGPSQAWLVQAHSVPTMANDEFRNYYALSIGSFVCEKPEPGALSLIIYLASLSLPLSLPLSLSLSLFLSLSLSRLIDKEIHYH